MAYDWWDNKIAGRRKAVRTQKAYRPELELHLLPFFGGMAVKDISRRDVDAFVQQQIKKGLAPSYINSHLQRLGQILDLAMDWYQTPPVLLENPAKGKARRVENPNTPDADRWLEPDQVELLLHAARKLDEGAPQTRVSRAGKTYTLRPRADYLRLGRESIVAGLCFSGLRNTELCDLTWARIDFARRGRPPGREGLVRPARSRPEPGGHVSLQPESARRSTRCSARSMRAARHHRRVNEYLGATRAPSTPPGSRPLARSPGALSSRRRSGGAHVRGASRDLFWAGVFRFVSEPPEAPSTKRFRAFWRHQPGTGYGGGSGGNGSLPTIAVASPLSPTRRKPRP
jgi:integrase